MIDILTLTALSIAVAGFVVGVVVGLTGMGGGALMTPALIFLGVGGGEAATVVTADLTAAAVYKTGGAVVHAKEGSPNLKLAMWLIIGSVPMAFVGPYAVKAFTTDAEELDRVMDGARLAEHHLATRLAAAASADPKRQGHGHCKQQPPRSPRGGTDGLIRTNLPTRANFDR